MGNGQTHLARVHAEARPGLELRARGHRVIVLGVRIEVLGVLAADSIRGELVGVACNADTWPLIVLVRI